MESALRFILGGKEEGWKAGVGRGRNGRKWKAGVGRNEILKRHTPVSRTTCSITVEYVHVL